MSCALVLRAIMLSDIRYIIFVLADVNFCTVVAVLFGCAVCKYKGKYVILCFSTAS